MFFKILKNEIGNRWLQGVLGLLSAGQNSRQLCRKTKIKVEKIVSGGAKGADTLAARYASEHSYPLEEFKPDYGLYGRGAPLKRNTTIVENSDIILAFVTASSKGTWDTIRKAQAQNKIVRIYNV